MPKIFRVLFLSAFFASLILALIYLPELKEGLTHENEKAAKEKAAYIEAEQLLLLGRPLEALEIVKQRSDLIHPDTPKGKAWLEILVKGSEALPDTEQLKEVFIFHPDALKNHEKGALLLAAKLISEGDANSYEQLRAFYKNQETDPIQWMLLDADSLIVQGNPESAVTLLKSRYFEGSDDAPRLLRLALLHLNHHPKVSWDYLSQAQKKDPSNLDISLFRARLLESAGKGDLAEAEWNQTLKKGALNNPVIKDELVDFYIRRRNYGKALAILQKDLSYGAKEPLLLKALFLSKVIEPLPFHFPAKSESLQSYASSLPEGKFWDESAAPARLKISESLGQEPSSLWLRMLENLRVKRESDALTLLQHDMRETTFDPELKSALIELLKVRLNDEPPTQALTAFMQLSDGDISETELFLKGPDAFYVLFLSRGWNEAALNLYPSGAHSDNTPLWVKEAYAKALRKNRGLKEALAYLALQEDAPSLRWMKANYLLQNDQEEEGEEELEELANLQGSEAEKAAYLLAERAFKEGAWEKSTIALGKQDSVLNSPKGQLLLARIALGVNDEEEAQRIYQAIQEESFEAKSYLAKRAFEEGDYRQAYQLTEQLLKKDPENQVLKDNLNLLMKAQPG